MLKHVYIFSDSHGYLKLMQQALDRAEQVDAIVFLGDMNRDIERIREQYPLPLYYIVEGNNDYQNRYNLVYDFYMENVHIFMCHGHTLRVKHSLDLLFARAHLMECQIALYGHTHIPAYLEHRGVTLVNPGSCTSPYGTYVHMTIDGEDFHIEHCKGDGTVVVL